MNKKELKFREALKSRAIWDCFRKYHNIYTNRPNSRERKLFRIYKKCYQSNFNEILTMDFKYIAAEFIMNKFKSAYEGLRYGIYFRTTSKMYKPHLKFKIEDITSVTLFYNKNRIFVNNDDKYIMHFRR